MGCDELNADFILDAYLDGLGEWDCVTYRKEINGTCVDWLELTCSQNATTRKFDIVLDIAMNDSISYTGTMSSLSGTVTLSKDGDTIECNFDSATVTATPIGFALSNLSNGNAECLPIKGGMGSCDEPLESCFEQKQEKAPLPEWGASSDSESCGTGCGGAECPTGGAANSIWDPNERGNSLWSPLAKSGKLQPVEGLSAKVREVMPRMAYGPIIVNATSGNVKVCTGPASGGCCRFFRRRVERAIWLFANSLHQDSPRVLP
ncbi:MAG: hypothetical protein QGG36_04735 [Pirellulaceae bacterium]|jgi:hypothetical protein|nr:hypothetical protein [Pirellulaceae bacterium]